MDSRILQRMNVLLLEFQMEIDILSNDEFDPAIVGYLQNDCHKLRGRMMQGATDQKWQNAIGSVDVRLKNAE